MHLLVEHEADGPVDGVAEDLEAVTLTAGLLSLLLPLLLPLAPLLLFPHGLSSSFYPSLFPGLPARTTSASVPQTDRLPFMSFGHYTDQSA